MREEIFKVFIENFAKDIGLAKNGKLLCFHKWKNAGASYHLSQYIEEFQICMKCRKARWKLEKRR
jgi:hypothetical protein